MRWRSVSLAAEASRADLQSKQCVGGSGWWRQFQRRHMRLEGVCRLLARNLLFTVHRHACKVAVHVLPRGIPRYLLGSGLRLMIAQGNIESRRCVTRYGKGSDVLRGSADQRQWLWRRWDAAACMGGTAVLPAAIGVQIALELLLTKCFCAPRALPLHPWSFANALGRHRGLPSTPCGWIVRRASVTSYRTAQLLPLRRGAPANPTARGAGAAAASG